MSELGQKLIDLRTQIDRRASLEETLLQLNQQKMQIQGQLEPLEHQLDNAIKKIDKLDKKGIFSLFRNRDKYDMAYTEMSALKAEYSVAKNSLDRINHDIQKVFNQMADYSDAERQYNNLMSEVNTALKNGNTDIITEDELEQLHKHQIRARISQLNKAVAQGKNLINVIDGYIRQADHKLSTTAIGESLRIAIMKFRTALDDNSKAAALTIETESFKRIPNFLFGYDPLGRDRYFDNVMPDMYIGMTKKELQENLAELSHNTQQIIDELVKETETLKSLL